MRNLSGVSQGFPKIVWVKTRYFFASSIVLMPPLALKPALRLACEMVSSMALAASGVADLSVFPVEVLMKPTPCSRQSAVASEMREVVFKAPVSNMIFDVCSPHKSVVIFKKSSQTWYFLLKSHDTGIRRLFHRHRF